MKQRISVTQLAELTPEQQERLREWWRPQDYDVVWDEAMEYVIEVDLGGGIYMTSDSEGLCPPITKEECLPLLSIGQMIELLQSHDECLNLTAMTTYINGRDIYGWEVYLRRLKVWKNGIETIDALWQAVKEVLQ